MQTAVWSIFDKELVPQKGKENKIENKTERDTPFSWLSEERETSLK